MGLFPIWLFSSHVRGGLIRRARRFYVVVPPSITHSEKIEKEGQFKVKLLEINQTGVLQVLTSLKDRPYRALSFLKRIEGNRTLLGVQAYATVIRILCSCSSRLDQKLEQLLVELIKKGDEGYMKKRGVVPDLATYTMIQDHIPELLRKCGNYLPSHGFKRVEPDDVAYAALINGCCKSKCEDKARKLIHEMVEKGITPLEPCMVAYVVLKQEMLEHGMMTPFKACEDLYVLIENMLEKEGMMPSKACMDLYVLLKQGMVENGMMTPSKACEDLDLLIHEMVEKKGMTPPEACMATYVRLRQEMVENGMMASSKACEDLYLIIHEMLPEACKDLYVELIREMVEKGSRLPKAYMDIYVKLTQGT
ncbi:hypothetical protein Bca52824_079250 [Brassica carinata]|uniref:Uncharacterized protein n=1 Tax=Brassica carinata TaxID=52824 RepID=A0A8X7U1S1_BRACI|nr:hypothetical protein Bca52824_079250 [Brassica carinata]